MMAMSADRADLKWEMAVSAIADYYFHWTSAMYAFDVRRLPTSDVDMLHLSALRAWLWWLNDDDGNNNHAYI